MSCAAEPCGSQIAPLSALGSTNCGFTAGASFEATAETIVLTVCQRVA